MKFKTGIYGIFNLVNGKVYIGSAGVSFRIRWNTHKSNLRRNKHQNKHLQRAWNKYGKENFEFRILKRCKPWTWILLDLEDEWTDKYRSIDKKMVYNIRPHAHSNLGFRHSEESKEKMSRVQKGRIVSEETRAKLKGRIGGFVGKKHTIETKLKMAKAAIGRKHGLGTKRTPEVRAKMSEAQKIRWRKWGLRKQRIDQ